MNKSIVEFMPSFPRGPYEWPIIWDGHWIIISMLLSIYLFVLRRRKINKKKRERERKKKA